MDNQNIIHILETGSRKPDLHGLVKTVIESTNEFDIHVSPIWVPREEHQMADYLSKLPDSIKAWKHFQICRDRTALT